MANLGIVYEKLISPFYKKSPEKVEFMKVEYLVKKNWKIGLRDTDDMTRKEFRKEMEDVRVYDVN